MNPVPFRLNRMECNPEGKSVDLYFTADTETKKFFHILAQCPQSHPFFVKDKGKLVCVGGPPFLPPPFFPPVPDRGTGTCARDRRVLQQLALNVHVKHSDLT